MFMLLRAYSINNNKRGTSRYNVSYSRNISKPELFPIEAYWLWIRHYTCTHGGCLPSKCALPHKKSNKHRYSIDWCKKDTCTL